MSIKFQSKYSPDKEVNPAQYITEIICEKKAGKEGKSLSIRFWTLPEWKKFFCQQVIVANSLLKIYSAQAIVKALNGPKAKYIYSLRAPHLDALIEVEQKAIQQAIDNSKESTVIDYDNIKTTELRKPVSKATVIDKLRDL